MAREARAAPRPGRRGPDGDVPEPPARRSCPAWGCWPRSPACGPDRRPACASIPRPRTGRGPGQPARPGRACPGPRPPAKVDQLARPGPDSTTDETHPTRAGRKRVDAVAVCADCGAAVCHDHARVTARWLTRTMVINRVVAVEPPARTIRCGICQAARDAAPAPALTGPGTYRAAGRAPGFVAVAAGRCGAVHRGSGGSWGAGADGPAATLRPPLGNGPLQQRAHFSSAAGRARSPAQARGPGS